MLTQIHIANLVTIEKAHLDVENGVTVITGETGAGKSILIEAIELALGGRASSQLIRPQQDKCDISVAFDLSKMKALPSLLTENELVDKNGEYIIRRVIHRDGKSRCFINDTPVTLPILRELGESLMDMHGQHEHQSLLKPDKHREMLDDFAGHTELAKDVQQTAIRYREITELIQHHQTSQEKRSQQQEFLRFQLNDLESLQLQEKEWEQLDTEHKQLAHTDALQQGLGQLLSDFTENEVNVLAILKRSIKTLESIQQVHPKISQWLADTNTATIQLDDMATEIDHYLNSLEANPERLFAVEQRIQIIHDYSRKYKVEPSQLLNLIQKLQEELNALTTGDASLAELHEKQKTLLQEYEKRASQLSEKRAKAAKKLGQEITATIKTLSLPHAEFAVELNKESPESVSPHGREKVTFMVKTNKGSEFHPLIKIASGGELSRISLAIHLATAGNHTVPTLIFDEVDVGIGGSTAELVGRLLRRLGKTHQLLCITHLPQVAAYGHHHVTVQKTEHGDTMLTQIRSLTLMDKIKEIARMLGGVEITETTLKHAQEMLEGVKA